MKENSTLRQLSYLDVPMKAKLLFIFQLGAVVLTGLLCGVFLAFALDVSPALQRLDAATYIQTQQQFNQTVSNLGFALLFFGAMLFPFLTAGMAAWQSRRRMAMYWLLVALLHFVGVYWVSIATNIPLHQDILAWNPAAPPADWQTLRDTWTTGNWVRTIAEAVCFIGALTLLVLREQLAAQPRYVMRQQN
jgi:uncharacterized membrane protein